MRPIIFEGLSECDKEVFYRIRLEENRFNIVCAKSRHKQCQAFGMIQIMKIRKEQEADE